MKVLVTGASGGLGSAVVKLLRETEHEVVATSRTRTRYKRNVTWLHSDLMSGQGLNEALEGVEVVIHTATNPMKQAEVFEVNRLAYFLSLMTDVKQFIYPSIVGIEDVPLKYYQLKLQAERMIATQDVPYTICRATQFHHFVDKMLLSVPVLGHYLLPKGMQMQSVAVEDFAAHLIDQIEAGAQGRIDDFAGPEILSLAELVEMKNKVTGRSRKVRELPLPGKLLAAFRAGKHTNPERKCGSQTFMEYLEKKRS